MRLPILASTAGPPVGDRPSPSELEHALRAALVGEVRFDAFTRHMFSTDASMYAIEPLGVVFPRDVGDVVRAIEVASRFDVPVLPRGAGTGLTGETVGAAVVLDFSRHMNGIVAVDPSMRTARVQPGAVQDDLNRAVESHGLFFAPDTSTSNRATLGGMIGNNSCGSRSARYGMTIDHVVSLKVVLSDGSVAELEPVERDEAARRGAADSLEGRLYREIPTIIESRAEAIRAAMPAHWRRSGGYRLERLLPEAAPLNLANLVVGAQGTLAVVVEATVRLEPRPAAIAGLVGHFHSVREAVTAATVAMDAGATTVELLDRMILDLARRSPEHAHLSERLVGDPGAILWIEIYGDTPAEVEAAMERLRARWEAEGHGYAAVPAPDAGRQRAYRELRKAGLGLLMNAGTGRERGLAFVEDTAVDPRRLPEYTDRLAEIFASEGLRAGFYGHASAGCIHLRPFMDVAKEGEVARIRRVAEAVLELVIEFGGMNSSEHGDGLARSEFNPRFFGPDFYRTMVDVKRLFDPDGRFNPGKKVDAPPMTEHLKDVSAGPGQHLETHFDFSNDGGMWGLADRCIRIGACRKSPDAGGTMCPSYMATRDEEHSTRGRANALALALTSARPETALADPRLHEILDLCLECKACRTECPKSVDMATMKAEFLAHYQSVHGVPLRSRVFAHVRALNRVGSFLAPVANVLARLGPARAIGERLLGIDRRRALPSFHRRNLSRWFRSRPAGDGAARIGGPGTGAGGRSPRGEVVLLADSFTSYTEPEVGRAAVELLEAAGWTVRLEDGVCCGRSAISKGLLDEAKRRHRHLLAKLGPSARAGVPIVGMEPSCLLTLTDELPSLAGADGDARVAGGAGAAGARDAGGAVTPAGVARTVADQARLVEELLAEALDDGSLMLDPEASIAGSEILFHPHCHQKAARATRASLRILEAIPGARVRVLDAGCCGMAGSFGFEAEHFDLSMDIGRQRLFPAIERTESDVIVAATGTSCRLQILHGTGRPAEHPVVLLRRALKTGPGSPGLPSNARGNG
jgi:FAD/FMN-containing dehydrogenase/Fe-S oxidoreductase